MLEQLIVYLFRVQPPSLVELFVYSAEKQNDLQGGARSIRVKPVASTD